MKTPLSIIGQKMGGINLDTLEGRINFQKSVYLLKEMGAIKEDYKFSWYIFGPYSSEVAKLGFGLIQRKTDTDILVSDDFESKVKKFQSLIDLGKTEPKWLELLASLHYIIKYQNKSEKSDAFKEISSHQEYFSDEVLFERAWGILHSTFTF